MQGWPSGGAPRQRGSDRRWPAWARRATVRRYSFGRAEAKAILTRRTLILTSAPGFRSFRRIVPQVALGNECGRAPATDAQSRRTGRSRRGVDASAQAKDDMIKPTARPAQDRNAKKGVEGQAGIVTFEALEYRKIGHEPLAPRLVRECGVGQPKIRLQSILVPDKKSERSFDVLWKVAALFGSFRSKAAFIIDAPSGWGRIAEALATDKAHLVIADHNQSAVGGQFRKSSRRPMELSFQMALA